MFFKKISLILLLNFFLFLIAVVVLTKPAWAATQQIIIINPTRGEECCHPGSLANLKFQVELAISQQTPMFFALRYDALIDSNFINYLNHQHQLYPKLINLAILTEITPKLAEDSGVKYWGNQQNWHQAQFATSLGYQIQDRQKLFIQLWQTFKQKFGFYPQLSVGWVIDTQSLNFLQQNFNLKMHQITREQWGIDSYTLDGGIEHYPYPASSNWFFIPDYQNPKPLFIIRQTISDPLFNYGDQTSTFTSQPNDYLQNKTFNYFQALLHQALNQPDTQPGFAILGLENSMADKFQLEFAQQIKFLTQFDSNLNIKIINDIKDIINLYKDRQINIYYGKDLINNSQNQVFFINTAYYRLRLRQTKNQLFIDDLRIYHPKLKDIYQSQIAQKYSYYITPFILNGARFFQTRSIWQQFFIAKPWWQDFGLAPQPDINHSTEALILSKQLKDQSPQVKFTDLQTVEISYKLTNHQQLKLTFKPDEFNLTPFKISQFYYQNITPNSPIKVNINHLDQTSTLILSWPLNQETSHQITISCQNQTCQVIPQINPDTFAQTQQLDYPYYFPQIRTDPIDLNQTLFFAHNQFAITGRNPIRLILVTRNQRGFPTLINQLPQISSNQPVTISSIQELEDGIYFADVNSSSSGEVQLQANLKNGIKLKPITVYFAPNCQANWKFCLIHPKQFWWFGQTKIRDKFRK